MTLSNSQSLSDQDPWASATHEGNRRQQLLLWASMPFEKKIEWLEEADRLAEEFAAARVTARPVVPPQANGPIR